MGEVYRGFLLAGIIFFLYVGYLFYKYARKREKEIYPDQEGALIFTANAEGKLSKHDQGVLLGSILVGAFVIKFEFPELSWRVAVGFAGALGAVYTMGSIFYARITAKRRKEIEREKHAKKMREDEGRAGRDRGLERKPKGAQKPEPMFGFLRRK